MSNKNDKNAQQKKLAEKQRLKNKKLLLQIEAEIKKLEFEIKNTKVINAKIYAIKILKIFLRFLQLITPFIATVGIVVGIFSALGGTPFYRDKRKQTLQMMKEFDNYGHIRYEQQYADYNGKNLLSYYGKWIDSGNGFYSRDVEVYSLGDITEETIIKLVNENNISSVQEVLGSPISKKVETNNNLTQEEINNNASLQALIYLEFEDDYIFVNESIDDNIGLTLLCILAAALLQIIPLLIRLESGFSFRYCVKEIKRNNQNVDVEELTKKLEIKRSNYERLTRK